MLHQLLVGPDPTSSAAWPLKLWRLLVVMRRSRFLQGTSARVYSPKRIDLTTTPMAHQFP